MYRIPTHKETPAMALDTSKPEMQSIGNYDLLAKIAEGGMGSVYKGRHRQTGRDRRHQDHALDMARNEVLLKRFEQEFLAASRLDHPNIVRALEYCGTGSTPFLVMEFVDGESLGQRLDRERQDARGRGDPHHRPGLPGPAPGATSRA